MFASLSSLSWYPVFFGLSYVQDRREILAPDGSINKEKQKALFQAYLAIFGSMEVVWQGVYMLAQPILEKATGMGEEVSTVVTHATLAAIFTFDSQSLSTPGKLSSPIETILKHLKL